MTNDQESVADDSILILSEVRFLLPSVGSWSDSDDDFKRRYGLNTRYFRSFTRLILHSKAFACSKSRVQFLTASIHVPTLLGSQ